MSQFKIHTIESAPEAAQEALKAVQNANGFIPNLIGVLANAPTALETYRTVGGINGRNSLTANRTRSGANYCCSSQWLWFLCSRPHEDRFKSVKT